MKQHRLVALLSLFLTTLFLACSGDDAGTGTTPPSPDGGIVEDGAMAGPRCGDGQLDPGEACDDGNALAGDGCEPTCTKTPPPVNEVVCKTLTPLASGTCAVTAGGAPTLLTGTVLTSSTVYRGGSVLVDDKGTISCVGCDCDAAAQGATTIVCPTGVISPGLVNTHDHITFSQNQPYTDTGERYEHRHDWRKGENGHTKISAKGGATQDQVRWAELRFLLGGATSTVGSGSVAGLLRNLDKSADEIGLAQKPVDFQTFPLGDSNGLELASGCGYPAMISATAIAGDDSFEPHVAEGIGAAATNEFDCLSSTQNGGQDLLAAKTAMIHSIGLTAPDYAAIGKEAASIIWSPRSNITLYGDTAVVTEAARLGVRIALGTDWMPTGSMNLLRELACADSFNKTYLDGFFTDQQLWRMVTVDAAHATATDDVIGELAQGKIADIAVFDGAQHDAYRAVVAAEPKDVVLVMRAGKPLYGDEAVVSAVPGSGPCDPLDVCGGKKRVCLQSEIGKTLLALESAVGSASAYPAFFCGVPAKEPTCTPKRPKSVNGSTIYDGTPSATDADGDGIADATDDCPRVFNPVRPMDGGKQADFDGDGAGDACDPCPLDANSTSCKAFDPDDVDGDGKPNAMDNCPNVANADQADADGDGKGDVCDPCPSTANPGTLACPATIYDIKQGKVAVAATVSLTNQLVTAANASGFFLQAKSGDPGYAGVDDSGVYVYAPGNTVSAGDRVTLPSATVQNYFGQIQLAGGTITPVSSTGEAAPPPVAVTPADVQTNGPRAAALEGVLVQVSDVTVTDTNPPPGTGDTAPTNEFVVDGAVRVNDFLYLIAPAPALGAKYTSITGVLEYRNASSKIEPRGAADVVLGPPQLSAFDEASTFVRAGATNAPTIPVPLAVQLTAAATQDTFVAIASSDPASLTVVNGGVTVPTGQTSAQVLVNGVQQAASVTLTATLDQRTATSTVRVIGAGEQPAIASLTPANANVVAGGRQTFTVTLDVPPATATDVALALAPSTAGTIPASVTVAPDQISATFEYVDASMVSSATVTVTLGGSMQSAAIEIVMPTGGLVINEVDYDMVGTPDNAEFVEIYNASNGAVALAGTSLVLVNGANNTVYKTIDLSPAGTLDAGQYLVVGATSVVGKVPAGQKTIDLGAVSDVVQNGSPDGLALVSASLLDALSYEGAMTMAQIPPLGTVSLVEGTVLPTSVADSNKSPGSLCRIPNGSDTDDAATDWALCGTSTPGAPNAQ